MSIRGKVFAIFGISLVVLSLLAFGVGRVTFYDQFVRHEREMFSNEAYKLVSLYAGELDRLGAIAGDWGPWDETYRFVQDHNENYVDRNLDDDTIRTSASTFWCSWTVRDGLFTPKEWIREPINPALFPGS